MSLPVDMPKPDGYFTITGRGLVAAYKDGRWTDPQELLHQLVRIEDEVYRVTGVEMFLTPVRPYTKPFGLLIKKDS